MESCVLGPPHTGFNKVWSTFLIHLDSIVFTTTLHTSVEPCCHHVLIMIEVYFVRAVQENPLVIPQATMLCSLCAVHRWCAGANKLVEFEIMLMCRCAEALKITEAIHGRTFTLWSKISHLWDGLCCPPPCHAVLALLTCLDSEDHGADIHIRAKSLMGNPAGDGGPRWVWGGAECQVGRDGVSSVRVLPVTGQGRPFRDGDGLRLRLALDLWGPEGQPLNLQDQIWTTINNTVTEQNYPQLLYHKLQSIHKCSRISAVLRLMFGNHIYGNIFRHSFLRLKHDNSFLDTNSCIWVSEGRHNSTLPGKCIWRSTTLNCVFNWVLWKGDVSFDWLMLFEHNYNHSKIEMQIVSLSYQLCITHIKPVYTSSTLILLCLEVNCCVLDKHNAWYMNDQQLRDLLWGTNLHIQRIVASAVAADFLGRLVLKYHFFLRERHCRRLWTRGAKVGGTHI